MNQSGMTLLEVLVSLAIVGMMLVVAVPFVDAKRPGFSVNTEARRIAADLRKAQSDAVRNNRQVDFTLDVRSGVFGHDRYERLSDAVPGMAVSLFTTLDQKLDNGAGTIRFFPDGGSTGGGVKLSAGAKQVQILVDWLTGRVSVVGE
jgi:general secretion pathway protein H